MYRIRELGFCCADVLMFENWIHLTPSRLAAGDRTQADEFVAAVSATGLEITSLNCGPSVALNDREQRDRYLDEFHCLLGLAREVNCRVLTVQTGRLVEGRTFEDCFEAALEGMQALRDVAHGTGVQVTFEPHQGAIAEKPADALRMVRGLWPDVGIVYDPSHFVMQDIPLTETETLLEYTGHVHLRNAASGKMQVPMAEGTIDFGWVIARLRAVGYDGPLALEYLGGAVDEAVKLRDLLRGLLE
jgi:hydroxypyruvate isomerase